MEEITGIGIGGKPFKLMLSSKAFANEDVINGGVDMKIVSEPEQIQMLLKSRWWIVNWWRKITKTERTESVWQYTVKMVDDGTGG
jgi:hypothetical protein